MSRILAATPDSRATRQNWQVCQWEGNREGREDITYDAVGSVVVVPLATADANVTSVASHALWVSVASLGNARHPDGAHVNLVDLWEYG